MQKDYLVVGLGLAGLAFCSILEQNKKRFHIIDHNANLSNRVIGGMYNPIILKRFSPAWKAHEMWQKSILTYQYLERKFAKTYFQPFKIFRILKSIEEQNNWTVASDKVVMKEYMTTQLVHENISGIDAPYGFGELQNVGRVEGEQILQDYKEFVLEAGLLSLEAFDYEDIIFKDQMVYYKGQAYKHIVFCEGSYIAHNPYFNYLPMKVSKGEMLIVEIPDLEMKEAIKSSCFMVPLGNHMFIVGATYNWEDKTVDLTPEGQAELEEKLQSFLKLPYRILDYKAGIRPTVSDRRPLLGKHPQHPQLAILNGLGTRGIIYAPALAEILFNHLENNQDLDPDLHITRFSHDYNETNRTHSI
jgi:glycine oxidase